MGTSIRGENPAALPGKVLAHQIRTVAGKSIVNGVNTLIMKGIALPGELRQQQNRGGGSKKEFDRYGKVTERFCNVFKTTNVGKATKMWDMRHFQNETNGNSVHFQNNTNRKKVCR